MRQQYSLGGITNRFRNIVNGKNLVAGAVIVGYHRIAFEANQLIWCH